MQKEIEYLGYSLTIEGVKPQKKKVHLSSTFQNFPVSNPKIGHGGENKK